MTDTLDILERSRDGDNDGRILWGGVHRSSGSDTGRLAIPHYFQRGGGFVSASLGVSNGVCDLPGPTKGV